MLRAFLFVFLLTVFTLKSFAIEPILDQQATAYFNISFDVGYKKKSTHEFGLRIDRGLIKPGEIMTISQLNPRPAVFNFGFNSRGLKTFELNGADLTDEYYVYYGAETLERHIRIFDPDKTKDGPVSILPKEIKEVISFSKMSKVDQKEFLKDKFRSKFEVLGRKNRSLTDQEILNRNYYRGRFCSFLKKTKFPVFNWENTPLKNNH